MSSKLKPLADCPHCGERQYNKSGYPRLQHGIDRQNFRHYVICWNCGARGPNAANRFWATRKWNKRKVENDD